MFVCFERLSRADKREYIKDKVVCQRFFQIFLKKFLRALFGLHQIVASGNTA